MIRQAVENFHRFMREDGDALNILAEDCKFYSPVVFRGSQGKLTVNAYLSAARRAFASLPGAGDDRETNEFGFRYTRKVFGDDTAVLEFECEVDGIKINGVDILACNDRGEITELKVMVRPLKAIEKVRELMEYQLRRPAYEIGAAAPEKKTVLVNGLKMTYADMGEGDPILFLHGNPTSSYLWRNIMPELAKHGRCIAPDLIGMGDSEKLPGSGPDAYRFVEHRDYLDGLLDALGINQNVVLMLHDWGSALGFDWANRNRQAVQGIAYTESIVSPMKWSEMAPQMTGLFQAMRSPKGDAMVIGQNFFVEKMLPSSVFRELTADEMEAYRKPFAAGGEARRPTLTWPRELPVDGEPADVNRIVEDYGQWLAGCDLPKLFIDAEPGTVLTGKYREFCRSWPNQTEVKVRGLHYVQEDSPNEIASALADFVSTLRR